MESSILLLPILLPVVAGLLVLTMRKSRMIEPIAFLVMLANLVVAGALFQRVQADPKLEYTYFAAWVGQGLDFWLRLYQFPAFILLASAVFAFLVTMYSWKFMAGRNYRNQFYGYMLITVSMVNGAVLADHLVVLLFFWEGLLATMFGMIAIGRPGAWKTATKAFVITGVTDLCMMVGMIMVGKLAGTLQISKIHLDLGAASGAITASAAFVFMMIGAISKAGSMPFHSWIPDAAVDAPLPFMAFLPASLEKLLGIYLLARISLDLFAMTPGHWVSTVMMIVGAVTILLAVMMALVQKDYKKLLSFHAISQVGYMILGIGTALPIGIVGGLFHMLNNAIYKSCLFLTGGSVELQAGTTDLNKLGGLAKKMPITFACFFVAAVSISGCPPFNGFFSKELIYAGALQSGWWYCAAALVGTFLTAASFLKLGHAVYFGKRDSQHDGVKEASFVMLLPMIVIAGFCVLFGLWSALPVHYLLEPFVRGAMPEQFAQATSELAGGTFGGWHFEHMMLPLLAVGALALALVNHLIGAKVAGSGLHAVDHIQNAPGLKGLYAKAELRWFDPYELFLKLIRVVSLIGYALDRINDWVYNGLAVGLTRMLSFFVRAAHTGSYALYILWCLAGAAAVAIFLIKSF